MASSRVTASVVALVVAVLPTVWGTDASTAAPARPAVDAEPSLVRLAWTGPADSTITIRWRPAADVTAAVRYRPAGTGDWTEQPAEVASGPLASGDVVTSLRGLAPATAYEYAITSADGWTDPATFSTAPTDGTFTVAFVADTGISGRLDGLTEATDQVVAAIGELDPLAVLGGGDYAYLNSDPRFRNDHDAGRDALISTLEPLTSTRPFMPAYGNHEVLLEENVDEWAARFSTPSGHDGRTSYSFDIAGVHFVALLAYESKLDDDTAEWLVSDLEAATARGVRTIVPYFHRNLYGSGTVHPPSPSLAEQLSTIFEAFPVNIVLTAHDQSYERTYPLVDGRPTTTETRRCFVPADGITYVKTSPGGKLSSQNWWFSGYSTTSPEASIAVRTDAMHHFSTVTFGDDGTVEVVTYGLVPGATEPVVVDRFTYSPACEPGLEFSGQPIEVAVGADDSSAVRSVSVIGGDDGLNVETEADWVEIRPLTTTYTVSLDTTALPAGRHATTLVATAPGLEPAELPLVVDVLGSTAAAELVLHHADDRTMTEALDGAQAWDEAFVELVPDEGADVAAVRFLLDGERYRLDEQPPFDLEDGARYADPFDTNALSDGPHTLEAIVVDSTGRSTRTMATFDVVNADPPDAPPVTDVPGDVAIVPPVTEPDASWWRSSWALILALAVTGLGVAIAGRRIGARR